MAIKQILFNAEMVRAILEGRKSCTRRLVKHDVESVLNSPYHKAHPEVEDKQIISKLCNPPYQPGDILYVRETWCDDRQFTHDSTPGRYFYKASENENFKWKPSIHMPKEAARIWLKATDVRVERLQEITVDGCHREGINIETSAVTDGETLNRNHDFSLEKFETLWDSTVKKSDLGSYGWNANPYVWVISFERCEKPEGV